MRLGLVGDIHGRIDTLRQLVAAMGGLEPTALLCTGDFAPRGAAMAAREKARADSISCLSALGAPVLWVPGNHDDPAPPVDGNMDGRVGKVGSRSVLGIGGAGPDRFGFPYEWSEEDIRAASFPPADILLTHAPPYGTSLDQLSSGRHVGSKAIWELAERGSGLLVCGHVHEAFGFAVVGRRLCVNLGSLAEPFALPQAVMVKWPDRGPLLASRHELREESLVVTDERSHWIERETRGELE